MLRANVSGYNEHVPWKTCPYIPQHKMHSQSSYFPLRFDWGRYPPVVSSEQQKLPFLWVWRFLLRALAPHYWSTIHEDSPKFPAPRLMYVTFTAQPFPTYSLLLEPSLSCQDDRIKYDETQCKYDKFGARALSLSLSFLLRVCDSVCMCIQCFS